MLTSNFDISLFLNDTTRYAESNLLLVKVLVEKSVVIKPIAFALHTKS